jgi:hypothetical protein
MNKINPSFVTKEESDVLLQSDHVTFVDAFSFQMKELYIINNPTLNGPEKDKEFETDAFKKFVSEKEEEVQYVYFPWNHTVIKLVGKDDYYELKTNRNRDLITAEEQEILYNKKVAVLGMSVGSNIAFVLTQSGISRDITVADFDELDTTNLNRIIAGIHEVGQNKTTVAAHHIYEDNPYANVKTMPDGVTNENLEELLKDGLDLIIEEIDDVGMKIETRKLAMKYKVPVVMVTDNGDGIILHIERYDLGYTKILHQDMEYWEKIGKEIAENGMTKELGGKIIIEAVVGGPQFVDPNMMASVQRVLKQELVSWSQLGSAAILGGVYATFAVKQILLGKDTQEEVRLHIHPKLQ